MRTNLKTPGPETSGRRPRTSLLWEVFVSAVRTIRQARLNGCVKRVYMTTADPQEPQMGEMVPLEAIDDVPKMNALEFMAEIGNNVALVGMWHVSCGGRILLNIKPYMSPSPYLALCVGTPFINPIISWDETNPRDRSMWNAQEPRLRWMDPPCVILPPAS